jgi:hypothetical protein
MSWIELGILCQNVSAVRGAQLAEWIFRLSFLVNKAKAPNKGVLPSENCILIPISTYLTKKRNFWPHLVNFSLFWALKLIFGQESTKIKKNILSTLVLEFFCQYKFSC